MKQFNQISKILLIAIAIVGLTVGISALTGDATSSQVDKSTATVKMDNAKGDVQQATQSVKKGKCGDGKCGDDAKKAMKESKCGDGKCCGDAKTVDSFSAVDANKDGKLSKEEFSAFGKNTYKMKDANSSGKIEKDECDHFDKFNADKNDFLSEEEFVIGHSSMFSKIDADGDNFITKKEQMNFKMSMHNDGKYGGDDAKCNGKCGDGKCGDDAKNAVKEAKCGGDTAKTTSEKVEEVKDTAKEVKCGAGKCG